MMTGRTEALAAALRERLALGDLHPGGALDSESALGSRYGVSRVTVRRALESLRDQGLIESRPGAGWFATAGTFRQSLAVGSFAHAGSAVAEAGKSVVRRTVSFGFITATPEVAALLALAEPQSGRPCAAHDNVELAATDEQRGGSDPPAEVLSATTLRTVDQVPLDLADEWVPARLGAPISRQDAEEWGIWSLLQRGGTVIDRVRQRITAAVSTEADAPHLDCAAGTPLLLVRRLALDASGVPVALSQHRYLAHRFSLEVDFHSWSGGADREPPGVHDLSTPTPPPPHQEHS